MKKYRILFAVAAIMALTACGSGSATSESKDSTAANVDSSANVADSSAAVKDSVAGGAKVEAPVK